MLDRLISFNQSAFNPNRLITDNILIAHEIFHSMESRMNSKNGFTAVKLDLMKAYDRVEWDFVHKMLLQIGFNHIWSNRLMSCISSVHFYVLINNFPSSVFTPSRGLRQGDPLSPYIFILITKGLSRIIQNYMA